ncbi:hypothetical protein L2K70_02270 [Nocardioides KLBMP 9356]|uniref:PD-(D/E)XK nuclease family protein n=1 Tax=Nocardioides potassii TaxID=2911371 RepID=A0ABS9H591_9ACTN|nr:hypothetical protein [Nocardioides potassii]MCF6376420.1 hypothetical protein [Nocardioides potassii]
MGDVRALALPGVSVEQIDQALQKEVGRGWDDVDHVTATTTLAAAIKDGGTLAFPIATLIDLVTLPGLPGEMSLGLEEFPGPGLFASSPGAHRSRIRAWQEEASGRRLRTGIQVDDSLRRFVREHANDRVGRALLASRRQYATTVHALVAAGVRPQSLRLDDPAARLAARAWAQAEVDVPSLGAPRDLLWVDLDDLDAQSTPEARGLVARIVSALEKALGRTDRRTIVHHGFYFYNPVQWAFFQALARVPSVEQVFVVHDDGDNPAFSTWRYFFRSEWQMPTPTRVDVGHEATPAARAFRDVLTGAEPGAPDAVRVVECHSPAELVRLWRAETADGQEAPARYAAAAEQVERYAGRLGREGEPAAVGDTPAPSLSQLPIGSFLLALHGCITQDDEGEVTFRLSPEALLDIVASGYLDVVAGIGARPPLVRRALPYFADCRSGDEWVGRASQLVDAVTGRVAPRGARQDADDDVTRIEKAVLNPTRLVPWADLSADDAARVRTTVVSVVQLLAETTAHERVVLGDHLRSVRHRLDQALRRLPQDEARAVDAKLRGLGVLTDEEIDVVGLVDVVAMILGRNLELEGKGEDDPAATKVTKLRGLDALGLSRAEKDLHLANMAEDAFPAAAQPVGWPFTLDDLRASTDDAVEPVTAGLLETRAHTAGLSDLYLFWLALDGVGPEGTLTVSWVSDAGGERRRLSPIVSLLTEPHSTDAVKQVAGGVAVVPGPSPAERVADRERPEPSEPDEEEETLVAAVDSIHASAAAASRACPRRFAIQWAMGPTASFGPSHLQSMLYGNVVGALEVEGAPFLAAQATGKLLWPHLTNGQQTSSYDKRVVKQGGARPQWLLTLKGTKNGSSALDAAYQMAKDGLPADELEVAPPKPNLLPPRAEKAEVCAACPVQSRCLEWRDPRDEK